MDEWLWLLIGAILAGPIWITLTLLIARRIRRNAKKPKHNNTTREQLVELGQLAGGLAHEIKNPLSTINVNLKLLSEDLARLPYEQPRGWLNRLKGVQREADRLKGILDDFLSYAGKYELALQKVDLRRLVDELADFFAPQAQAENIIMRTTSPDDPIFCNVDTKLIKQALLNLLINATQATSKGGELILKLSAHRNQAAIEVIDTGCGIAAEDLDNIFQVYYSTKKQGSGLGLSTTRRIVREHGGSIKVESEVGKGTRFVITLPLVEE